MHHTRVISTTCCDFSPYSTQKQGHIVWSLHTELGRKPMVQTTATALVPPLRSQPLPKKSDLL